MSGESVKMIILGQRECTSDSFEDFSVNMILSFRSSGWQNLLGLTRIQNVYVSINDGKALADLVENELWVMTGEIDWQ